MARKSWVNIPENSDFTIHNIPFGIFSTKQKTARVGTAIGDKILDLYAVAKKGWLEEKDLDPKVFLQDKLNPFIALGKSKTKRIRKKIQKLLSDNNSPLKSARVFVNQSDAKMHLPVEIGDYTDFYSSIEHATNVGTMFRDPNNALLPNWRHLPVGYHGRSSSIVVSGTDIHRPKGQTKAKDQSKPKFGPSARMDFELEMGFIIGKGNKLGESISTEKAEDHIFGMVIFNDWSARDIQVWEYVPLGPFLGKSFASSISPWVVTLEALDPFRVKGPTQKPAVLPYLKYKNESNFDIALEVALKPSKGNDNVICKSNYKYMYWNMKQQLAHHTVNGCNVRIGDLMASGTISGKDPNSYGSMLEISWAGTKPLTLDDGTQRTFIADNDTISMKAYSEKNGIRVGFGEVRSKLLPAK